MRTEETRRVEEALKQHFAVADAYRYNSASIRVRVVDPKFKGVSDEQRDQLVDPVLATVPENTQRDIINLVLMYPGEVDESIQAHINNAEFEHPTPSML